MVFRANLTVSTNSFEHKTARLLEIWITSNFVNPRLLSSLSPRLAIPAPSLFPLPQESNHGDFTDSEYSNISIQQTGSIEFLLRPQAPTPQSSSSQPNSVNSSKINKKIAKCDVSWWWKIRILPEAQCPGVYPPQLSTATRVVSRNFTA